MEMLDKILYVYLGTPPFPEIKAQSSCHTEGKKYTPAILNFKRRIMKLMCVEHIMVSFFIELMSLQHKGSNITIYGCVTFSECEYHACIYQEDSLCLKICQKQSLWILCTLYSF